MSLHALLSFLRSRETFNKKNIRMDDKGESYKKKDGKTREFKYPNKGISVVYFALHRSDRMTPTSGFCGIS